MNGSTSRQIPSRRRMNLQKKQRWRWPAASDDEGGAEGAWVAVKALDQARRVWRQIGNGQVEFSHDPTAHRRHLLLEGGHLTVAGQDLVPPESLEPAVILDPAGRKA